MIYLDNAAGSFPKAPGLGQAMAEAVDHGAANINRAVNANTAKTEFDIITIRESLANFFGCTDSRRLIFTSGVTMSLNLVMKGLLHPGDHCIISGMEHNAVWRPANQLMKAGVSVDIAPCNPEGQVDLSALPGLFRLNTKLLVLCHASNVCGTVQDAEAVGRICHEHDALFALDCAQTAGHLQLDMTAIGADALCFTGHKGLLGPQGTGGVALTQELASRLEPLISGGTGSASDSGEIPPYLPDRFEAGTMNLPGIAGLGHSIAYIQEQGLDTLFRHEMELTRLLLEGVSNIPRVRVAGIQGLEGRVGVVSLDFLDQDNAAVSMELEREYGILTRCGLHCAPLAHQSLGTYPQGTVRFSPGWATTESEIFTAVKAIEQMA